VYLESLGDCHESGAHLQRKLPNSTYSVGHCQDATHFTSEGIMCNDFPPVSEQIVEL